MNISISIVFQGAFKITSMKLSSGAGNTRNFRHLFGVFRFCSAIESDENRP